MDLTGWCEVFRAGSHGRKGTFTVQDLDHMVASFRGPRSVPVVIGHPRDDHPAWGWVAELRRDRDVLQARYADVEPTFARAVNAGRFPNRSVKVLRGKDGPVLWHVGFLGAVPPEIEGLAPFTFAAGAGADTDTDSVEIEFSTEVEMSEKASGMTPEELEALVAQRVAEAMTARDATFAAERAELETLRADRDRLVREAALSTAQTTVRGLVDAGRLPPAMAEGMAEFMLSLPSNAEVVEFSAGDGTARTASPRGWFDAWLNQLQSSPLFRTVAAGDTDPKSTDEVQFSADGAVDPTSLELLGRARAYQKQHNVSLEAALEAVV